MVISFCIYFITIKKMKEKEKGDGNMGLGVSGVQMVMKTMGEDEFTQGGHGH